MLGFLQGFAYGLFVTCLPWCLVGLANPRLAVPTERPGRWQVFFRYGLLVPFLSVLLWLTSLWGGFGPSLEGWLAGLAAIAVELPLERRWHRWRARRHRQRLEARLEAEASSRRAEQERGAREAGVAVLDPARPPVDADEVVLALCRAKQGLLDVRRPDLAIQADRLFSRYRHVLDVLAARFEHGELAFERAQALVTEVCLGAVDNLTSMASQARGVMGVDGDFVRRRLERGGRRLSAEERTALERRLELIEGTERRLGRLTARNESALTLLDDTAVALARIETGRPQASVAADRALEELRRFIGRAERYGRSDLG
ncbi:MULTISPECIES: cobyrinic acid a,c-diamide synthase [Halomonas]|uniref:Cobyrinic acid a,c-diamide synthase n=1 Tax=Halomonas flagellata TaxID=2920385 RepID=A0ABS9RYE3_9GAMM|nr:MULTISPECIES: cobyrinic acid a,c-diamide synthase [Halomonas]MCH4564848.1 cobyrinic acid a,c-diamide synthase [Halomonas flagellata]PXY00452.1 cobyrinic acid a,c-diamide synthase [Halomonas sp. LBP4]